MIVTAKAPLVNSAPTIEKIGPLSGALRSQSIKMSCLRLPLMPMVLSRATADKHLRTPTLCAAKANKFCSGAGSGGRLDCAIAEVSKLKLSQPKPTSDTSLLPLGPG